jgi:flagellar biosynthetic protein FliP
VSLGAYTGVALALGFVLVLLGLALKLLQRLAPGTTRGRVRIPMEVVQRLSIGPKQGVAVVKIGERLIAVSTGEGGMRRLAELGEEEAAIIAASTAASVASAGANRVDFRAAFSGALRTAGLGGAVVLALLASSVSRVQAQSLARTAAPTSGPAPLSPNAAAAAAFSLQRQGVSLQRPTTGPSASPSAIAAAVAQATQLLQSRGTLPATTQSGAASSTGTQSATTAQPGAAQAPQAAAAQKTTVPAAQVAKAAVVSSPSADLAVSKLAPQLDLRVGGGESANGGLRLSGTVGIVVMMGLLTLLPTLLLMMTSFTRILIVLHFLRQALGTQNAPPSQLVAAIALLLTGFVMAPALTEMNRDALQPWMAGKIEQGEMLERGAKPFRAFMLRQTRDHDLQVFVDLSHGARPATVADVPLVTLMSAFVTSELRTAFQIGFALFLPFIIIDVVVSSVLMSMGMFMLPPAMISLPFKLLLFVLVDGWTLIVQSLVASFK